MRNESGNKKLAPRHFACALFTNLSLSHLEMVYSNSPPVATLTISPLPQLTVDVHIILYIFISYGKLLIFVKICLNFSCIQLWTEFALKMYKGTVCRTHHRLDAECTFHCDGYYVCVLILVTYIIRLIGSNPGILLIHRIRVKFFQFIRCNSK